MPRERFSEKRLKRGGTKDILFPLSCGRVEFLVRNIICNVIFFMPVMLMMETAESLGSAGLMLLALIMVVTGLVAALKVCVIPRLYDLGWSPWAAVFTFVPGAHILIGLILLFAPGKPIR